MKGDNMKWPRFAKIQVFPSEVPHLIRYLNDCGWEGDDCYHTVEGNVQVRLKDEQDKLRYERAMKESGRTRLGRAEFDLLLKIFKVRPGKKVSDECKSAPRVFCDGMWRAHGYEVELFDSPPRREHTI